MSQDQAVLSKPFNWWRWAPAVCAALLGAFLALSGPSGVIVAAIAGGVGYLLLAALSIRQPLLFVLVFLLALEILPPLYLPRHPDTPIYLPLFFLPVGFLVAVCQFRDLRFRWDPIAKGLAGFLAALACSLPFAYWLSGRQVGLESLGRWFLLSQVGFIYFLVRAAAPREESRLERRVYPFLLAAAALSAGYGIVDFLWPVPLPHPNPNQFIWLATSVLRRGQGVFYDALNFANFSGIFLIVGGAAFLARKERNLGVARPVLVGLVAVLATAVLVSFSRSTGVGIAAALLVFAWKSGLIRTRRVLGLCLALAVPFLLLWLLSPDLWHYLVQTRVEDLAGIFTDPNNASSGRYETWLRTLDIVRENPQYLLFGIGYKTLSSTRLFHERIIVDNGYLSLLLETGMAGLASFMALSGAILRTFARLARNENESVAFWSAVMFALWVGELVQLAAVDAYTFWRNMVILVALMALTLNRAERVGYSPGCPQGERP